MMSESEKRTILSIDPKNQRNLDVGSEVTFKNHGTILIHSSNISIVRVMESLSDSSVLVQKKNTNYTMYYNNKIELVYIIEAIRDKKPMAIAPLKYSIVSIDNRNYLEVFFQ